MSTNDENEEVIDIKPIVEQTDDDGNDITDWKAIALDRTQAAERNRGIAQRYRTKFEKAKDGTQPKDEKPPSKSDELDYGQKAFLIANGVKDADEIKLVKDIMQNTGKSLDDVVSSKYFQNEINEIREAKKVENAIPSGTKRGSPSSADTVEYWISKGELPPASERDLRQKVVNARIKTEKQTNVFTNNPVVR